MTLIPYTRARTNAVDRIFDHSFFGADLWPSSLTNSPSIDANSDDEGLVVRLKIPGVAPERVGLEVQDRTLKLSIAPEEGVENTRSYTRAFRVPADLDTTKVEASLEYGVLSVRVPRAEEARARPVEISVQ